VRGSVQPRREAAAVTETDPQPFEMSTKIFVLSLSHQSLSSLTYTATSKSATTTGVGRTFVRPTGNAILSEAFLFPASNFW
jgi:hypothetical protein